VKGKGVKGLLSKIPEGKLEDKDLILIRVGLIAELDAINLYEQLASEAKDSLVKKVFLEIAKEEKEHVGEFLELLRRFDNQQVEMLEKGAREVREIE